MYNHFEGIDEAEFSEKLIKIRRDFHRYPEPRWTEYRTTVLCICCSNNQYT